MASFIYEILPPDRDTSDIHTPTPYFIFTKLEEDLKIWYNGISPRYVDLVSDFAGQEFFLLDGEALMHCVFNDGMLDLAGSKGGFQMLHLIYLVERFLLNLTRRRCFFSIVFFNDFENVSALSQSVETMLARKLARKLVIQHIGMALSNKIELHVFPKFNGPEFQAYIAKSMPYFIMTNDGSFNESIEYLKEFRLVRAIQRCFLYQMNQSRIAIALIDEIIFMDTKILTFVSEPTTHRTVDVGMNPFVSGGIAHALRELDDYIECKSKSIGIPPSTSTSPSKCNAINAIASYLSTVKVHPHYELSFIFLMHVNILNVLPLQDRAQADYFPSLSPALDFIIHNEFLPRIYNILNKFRIYDGFDIIDGRLFGRVIWEFTDPDHDLDLQDPAIQATQSLWEQLITNSSHIHLDFVHLRQTFPRISTPFISNKVDPGFSLANFHHPALTQYLVDPILSEAQSSKPSTLNDYKAVGFRRALLHSEVKHWHSGKDILPHPLKKVGEPNAFLISRRQRNDQLYRASMQRYAESMTSQGLSQITIVKEDMSKKITTKNIHINKPLKKPKASQEIIACNNLGKLNEERRKAVLRLKDLDKRMTDIGSGEMERKISLFDSIPRGKSDGGRFVAELQVLKIREYIREWEAMSKASSVKIDENVWILVEIYRALHEICLSRHSSVPSFEKIKTVLRTIGFPIPARENLSVQEDVALPFDFPKACSLRLPYPKEEFQLRFCGPYMEKALDGKEDDRVQFIPDGWQIRVLDILDKNESIVAVAPTSAGKTFIAYYAMEKILRGDDDGVLVYIAPTKALVNQIAAEVYARFSKKYPSSGSSIWAIHTRDYRINNPYRCQILVTVPEMLQIMLLSPRASKIWAPKLRRIIFDEVHSIGDLEGGVVWEQLLLTTTVPLIALSATVGNATEFHKWLSSVQMYHGIKCNLVVHPYRYSHLRKYVFLPNKERMEDFTGLKSSNSRISFASISGIEALHPYAALAVVTGTFPSDLALDASDCWELFSIMVSVARASKRDDVIGEVEKLRPEVFFREMDCIKSADIIRYEAALRSVVERWIASPSCKDIMASVISALSGTIDKQIGIMEKSFGDKSPYARNEYQKSLLPLLDKLNSADALPALVFHYDRHGIECLAQELVSALEAAENVWKEGNSTWQLKFATWQEWQGQAKIRQKQEDKAMKSIKGRSKEEMIRDKEGSWLENFDPETPLPQFSFQSARSKKSGQELGADIANLITWTDIPQWMVSCLKRGIGVHHSGLNRKLRQLVESFFRAGTLRVVIATGTLALGINMPCRTVIFAGDSIFLTALNFRQCSGRAGRRGFDPVGNVVFHGIPLSKVYRLLVSRIPDLVGHFPITTTLVSRLLQILVTTNRDSEYGRKAVRGLLEQSRISLGSEHSHQQVLHHFRFSIEYLLRQNLINASGESVALAGLVNHLYYTEPANFALAELLRCGVFHRICKKFEPAKPNPKILEAIVHILAHLFGRRIRKAADQEELEINIKQSPSNVILEPLSEDALMVLTNHNADIIKIYRAYAIQFGRSQFDSTEKSLPLSRVTLNTDNKCKSMVMEGLHRSALKYAARSAFVAISGHGDTFDTIDDLAYNTREGILIEASAVPSMDHFINPPVLDAYLLDFFKHGQAEALIHGNGIRRGDVWHFLDAFDRILGAIDESLKLIAEGIAIDFPGDAMKEYGASKEINLVWEGDDETESIEGDPSSEDKKVCEAFSILRQEFHIKFKKMWA